jgi:mannose-6-phosphate isomerase-like protein (cupin superfamily)
MTITPKIWGTTECLMPAPNCEVHKLKIKAHHRCSHHRHHGKANFFYVESGHLYIDVWRADDQGFDALLLRAGEALTVPAGVAHRFRTDDEPCEALEIYYHEPLAEDIERFDQGGPVDTVRTIAHHQV